MSKDAIARSPSGRPERQPVGYRNRLAAYDKDPNYVYRWVNATMDQGDRIGIFERAGYEKVPKSTTRAGDGRVTTSSALGSFETIPGGAGDTLVLMRIRKEWYDEDQSMKQEQVNAKENAQKRTPDGFYGKIDPNAKG